MPLTWEEPFGLVMPEAMACGTPVIAFRRGSAPELIRDGVTGFLVDNADEMAEAVGRLDSIDPYACRQHVTDRFSPSVMTRGYLRVYDWLLDRPHRKSSIEVEATPRDSLDADSGEAVAVA
jgi:glycosyltransferase involved in cell wall biosynthesis